MNRDKVIEILDDIVAVLNGCKLDIEFWEEILEAEAYIKENLK